MLEVRLDYLTREKKCLRQVCTVLHTLVSKGHEFYPNGSADADTDSPSSYNPFKFSYSHYLEYAEVYTILVYKEYIDVKVRREEESGIIMLLDKLQAKIT